MLAIASRSCRRASVVVACIVWAAPAGAAICRVTVGGSDFADSTVDWTTPTSLKQALIASGTCKEIWVAKGIYKPVATFAVANGVAVYGGFAGVETARAQRDPAANLTVLSGDIDGNDTVDANGIDVDTTHIVGGNAWHVVKLTSTGSTTVLDGFTITGGSAPNQSGGYYGGGLLCESCSATLSNLVFSGNKASYQGGAIYNNGQFDGNASPTLYRVTFRGNNAQEGGAVFNDAFNGVSSPSFSEVTFVGNSATGDGGAIANLADGTCDKIGIAHPTFTNVTFRDNSAAGGGAIYTEGYCGTSSMGLTNATFIGNTATSLGGAILDFANGSLPYGIAEFSHVYTNVTFNGNVAQNKGGAIAEVVANGGKVRPVLRNAILWGDLVPFGNEGPEVYAFGDAIATFDHSIVKGSGGSAAWVSSFGVDGGSNLDADPRLGAGYAIGSMQTLTPAPGSPAIDGGYDFTCPTADQRGIVRPQGTHCDIGAVETFPVDLIGHKSLEACWSQAVTKTAFLNLVRAQIDGAVTCVPATIGATYDVCNTPSCPGGVSGCPITTHASAFAGTFADGNFTATGTIGDAAIPIQIKSPFSKSCTFNATNVTVSYAPSYVFIDDGNLGGYAALLNRFSVSPTNYSIASADGTCQTFAGSVGPVIVDSAQAALESNLGQKLRDNTVTEAVCPFTP